MNGCYDDTVESVETILPLLNDAAYNGDDCPDDALLGGSVGAAFHVDTLENFVREWCERTANPAIHDPFVIMWFQCLRDENRDAVTEAFALVHAVVGADWQRARTHAEEIIRRLTVAESYVTLLEKADDVLLLIADTAAGTEDVR